MNRKLLVGAAVVGALLVLAGCSRSQPANPATSSANAAAAPLTRGAVVKIVRSEVRRALALRDWHRYAGYIGRYTGPNASALFSLSGLDRATATGNTSAKVRVIAYEDYECPYCKAFETTSAPTLHRKFHSRVLFVYRFYPLAIHGKVAQEESIAGACVARIAGPAAFRRFTRTVFAETGSNGKGTKTPTETLAKAALHGQDATSAPKSLDAIYNKCSRGKLGAALIAPTSAFKGVAGTPTIFVVNVGQHRAWRLAGALPGWVFEALIANVIAGKPGNSDWAIEHHKVTVPG